MAKLHSIITKRMAKLFCHSASKAFSLLLLASLVPAQVSAVTAKDDFYKVPYNTSIALGDCDLLDNSNKPVPQGVLLNDHLDAGDIAPLVVEAPTNAQILDNEFIYTEDSNGQPLLAGEAFTLCRNGAFQYTPPTDFVGERVFLYTASDFDGSTNISKALIHFIVLCPIQETICAIDCSKVKVTTMVDTCDPCAMQEMKYMLRLENLDENLAVPAFDIDVLYIGDNVDLDNNFTFVSSDTSVGDQPTSYAQTGAANSGRGVWTLEADLQPGESVQLELTLLAPKNSSQEFGGPFDIQAVIDFAAITPGNEYEDATQIKFCVPVFVRGNICLGITCTPPNGFVDVPCGTDTDPVIFEVCNTGPDTATDVRVRFDIPVGLSIASQDPLYSLVLVSDAGFPEVWEWNIGELGVDECAAVTLTFLVGNEVCEERLDIDIWVKAFESECINKPEPDKDDPPLPVLHKTFSITPARCADVEIQICDLPKSNICCFDQFCYTVILRNFGPCSFDENDNLYLNNLDLDGQIDIKLVKLNGTPLPVQTDEMGFPVEDQYPFVRLDGLAAGEQVCVEVCACVTDNQNVHGEVGLYKDGVFDAEGNLVVPGILVGGPDDPNSGSAPVEETIWIFVDPCVDLFLSICADNGLPCRCGDIVEYTVCIEKIGCPAGDEDHWLTTVVTIPDSLIDVMVVSVNTGVTNIEHEDSQADGDETLITWSQINLTEANPCELKFKAKVVGQGIIEVCAEITGAGPNCDPLPPYMRVFLGCKCHDCPEKVIG